MTLFLQLGKPMFQEKNWTIGHEIVFNILLILSIGVINYIYSFFLFDFNNFTISGLARFVGYAISGGFFPVVALVLRRQTQLNKKYLSNANEINQKIKLQSHEVSDFHRITLKGEYNEELNINIDDIQFIESEGNYIICHYETANGPRNQKLRSSLKLIESQFSEHSPLLKTHRAFLVNLKKVKSVNGNAQGLKLEIEGSEIEIPVSRSQVKTFKSAMKDLK